MKKKYKSLPVGSVLKKGDQVEDEETGRWVVVSKKYFGDKVFFPGWFRRPIKTRGKSTS